MPNDSIKASLNNPGLYVLSMGTGVAFVEVDGKGIAYQLDLVTLARDGELRQEGWAPDAVLTPTCFVRRD